ncbi:hypothetical protein MRX96_027685 [Rhipicephalus microplus]
MTFAGRVPKSTTNIKLAKVFLKRLSENDLKSVQDFGGSNFEVTFKSKVAVDRFLADSATIKVKGFDIRFEYRGLRTVSVRVFEYPADASDHVLGRALEVCGKVQSISTDNLTGLRITTGNRRAHMELCSPVPNITDVDDGHVVRCEYDGVVHLCRNCRLLGHEKEKCATPRCEQWGASYQRRTSQALRWVSPSTPLQAEAVLEGNHAVQCAAGRASNRGQCRGSRRTSA